MRKKKSFNIIRNVINGVVKTKIHLSCWLELETMLLRRKKSNEQWMRNGSGRKRKRKTNKVNLQCRGPRDQQRTSPKLTLQYTLFYPLRCPTTDPGIIITNIMAARTILKCSYGKSKLSSTKYVLTSSILCCVTNREGETLNCKQCQTVVLVFKQWEILLE